MADAVTLMIDGQEVTVPKGTLIVEAAKKLGIDIPVFCYHPKMDPVGMCRMCLVVAGNPAVDPQTKQAQLDAEGQPVIKWLPKPITACTTEVTPGMVVITNSEAVAKDRKAMLEFILTSHPLDCPICDKGGECPLQDLTYRHGPGKSRFDYDSKHHGDKKYPLGDLIVLDRERCIMCARCVRFQEEIAGDVVLGIEQRGRDAMIVSYSDPVFDSHYSGNTTDICPVGALTTRDFRFRARAWEVKNYPSICNLCGVGCNTVIGTRLGEVARIMPRQNEAVNEIWLCDKGRFGHHFTKSAHRLTKPLVRRVDRLEETSWEEALNIIAGRFQAIAAESGPAAIGGIAGAHLSNEDLYLFQKLLREVIGSPNIDHRIGLAAALDDDIIPLVGVGSGTDLGRMGRGASILVIGSDLDEEAPILYLRVAGAARHGAQLINAGLRSTKLDRQAQHALRYRWGSAAQLVLAMTHVIVTEGLTANEWVPARVDGFETFKEKLLAYRPKDVESLTGLPAEQIRSAARAFAGARDGIILYGPEAGNDPALRQAIANLAAVCGYLGRPNNGVIAVLPHANSRGAIDMGVLPHLLPGYQPSENPGQNARKMLRSGNSSIRALYLAAADPAAQTPQARERLHSLDFLVVQDLFLTETAMLADVVLPAAATAERAGSFTNLERRVQAFDPVLPPPGQACPDWLIFTRVASALGTHWTYSSAGGVMQEIARRVRHYDTINYQQLLEPVSLSRRMSHYIYAGMSFTADVREGAQWAAGAEFETTRIPLDWLAPEAPAYNPGSYTLVANHLLFDGGTMLGEAEIMAPRLAAPAANVSLSDAAALSITEGDSIIIQGEGQSITLPAHIDEKGIPGMVLVARNLPGFPAERLLGDARTSMPVAIKKA